jgi:hypothetical protein
MYLTAKDQPFFDAAVPGAILRLPRRAPPWLIVNHSLAKTLWPDWPGRLLTAEVVDPISDEEQRRHSSPLSKHAGYTRAAAVRIIAELDVAHLFGRNGDIVSRIIDFAGAIDEISAERLVRSRHAQANEIQNQVSERIRDAVEQRGSGLPAPFNEASPLGALYFLDQVITKRAQALVGDKALEDDPDDPEGAWLAEPWVGASLCLYDAALAVGVPDVVTADERSALMKSWRDAVGYDLP